MLHGCCHRKAVSGGSEADRAQGQRLALGEPRKHME
jgi:hypothetical protein